MLPTVELVYTDAKRRSLILRMLFSYSPLDYPNGIKDEPIYHYYQEDPAVLKELESENSLPIKYKGLNAHEIQGKDVNCIVSLVKILELNNYSDNLKNEIRTELERFIPIWHDELLNVFSRLAIEAHDLERQIATELREDSPSTKIVNNLEEDLVSTIKGLNSIKTLLTSFTSKDL